MKKFTKIAALAVASIATLFSLNSCKEDEVVVPEVKLPILTDVKIEGAASDCSASVTITAENATEVFYTYYATAEAPAEADKVWKSVACPSASSETIKVDLSELKAETEYAVEAYAQDKSEAKSEVFSFKFTTAKPDAPIISVKDNTAEDATTTAKFTVSVSNATSFFYCYYLEEQRPESPEMVEVVVEADGDYVVDIEGLPASTDGRKIYTFEVYAVNGDVTCDTVYTPFQTVEVKRYTVTEISVNPLLVSVNIDLTEGVCDNLAYIWTESEYYNENSVDEQIQFGYISTILEDTTFNWGEENFLLPNTSYTLAVVPIVYGEEGEFGQKEIIKDGEVEVFRFSTPAFEIGANDAMSNFEIDEAAITATTISATVYNAEGVRGFYYGIVPVSDVTDGDVAAYASKTLTESYLSSQTFEVVEYDFESQTTTTVIKDEVEINFVSLSMETEYYIFTVAITDDGDAGKIKSQKVSTKGVVVDASIKPEVSIEPLMDGMRATVTFGKCVDVYYYIQNTIDGMMTESEIQAKFVDDMASEYSTKLSLSEAVDGMASYEEFFLGLGVTYDFYYMGVDENGAMGNLEKVQFETLRPSYNSSASLNVTQNAELSSVETNDFGGTVQKVVLDVEMIDGAVRYIYDVVDSQYVQDTVENPTAPEIWGNYIIANSWSLNEVSDAQIAVDLYAPSYAIVLIPVDADGKYGLPVIHKTDMWNDGTNPDGGDGGDGGGITPRNN